MLREDAARLLPDDPTAQALGHRVFTLAELLSRYRPDWTPATVGSDLTAVPAVVQPHCHQHAVMGFTADRTLMGRVLLSRRTAAPKAGIHGMARTVAKAYASQGIMVNTVVPGYTETPLVTAISGSAGDRAAIVSRIPLGRPWHPEDVEGVMVYLAGDESAYATGSMFRVDGGMTML